MRGDEDIRCPGCGRPYEAGRAVQDDGLPTVEALRAAIQTSDDEPLESDGFCAHGVIGGAGCSEWEHGWIERVHRRLSGSGLNASEHPGEYEIDGMDGGTYRFSGDASESPPTLPPCPICGKPDLFIDTDGRPGCPHCEVAVRLGDASDSGQPPEGES